MWRRFFLSMICISDVKEKKLMTSYEKEVHSDVKEMIIIIKKNHPFFSLIMMIKKGLDGIDDI